MVTLVQDFRHQGQVRLCLTDDVQASQRQVGISPDMPRHQVLSELNPHPGQAILHPRQSAA
jgi:hypothetical protein